MAISETKGEFQEILARLKIIQEHTNGNSDKVAQPIPLIDPTANVQALLKAAMERQDDLRNAENTRLDELRTQQHKCDAEMQTLREQSIRDLAAAESKRIDALMLAESRRLDAQLTGQQSAVALAAEKATAQGNTLSAQIQTATSINSAAINELREAHEKRLSLLEQNQYQGVGAAGQRTEGRQQSQWAIGIGFTVAGLLIGIAVMVSHFIK